MVTKLDRPISGNIPLGFPALETPMDHHDEDWTEQFCTLLDLIDELLKLNLVVQHSKPMVEMSKSELLRLQHRYFGVLSAIHTSNEELQHASIS